MTQQLELKSKYERPKSQDAVRNSGTTFSFRADPQLATAIDRAAEMNGDRFISEFIRSAIIDKIEKVIREG